MRLTVPNALLHGAVAGEVGADVDKHQLLDSRFLGHAGRSGGAALAVEFSIGVHDGLVIPAHAEHHVGIPGKVGHGGAGLGVAGENDAAFFRIDTVGEGVEPGLDVLGGSGGHLPSWSAEHGTGAYVPGGHRWGRTRERPAAIDEDLLAEGVVHAGLPVVGEETIFTEDALSNFLR